jgi:Trp operon repressor
MDKKRANDGKKNGIQKRPTITPSVSDYLSREEWENACWRRVLESKELLQLLITSHERHDLVMRAAALQGLASHKSYREIGKELWLSPQTVSGIKKAASEKTYRSYLERSKKERKRRKYDSGLSPLKPKYRGRPRRTKYGTIYTPY